MDTIKTLNGLAENLHDEAKSIRSEIGELYDRFDERHQVEKDSEKRRQLLELSKAGVGKV